MQRNYFHSQNYSSDIYDYLVSNQTLRRVEAIKDLGLIWDIHCSFIDHMIGLVLVYYKVLQFKTEYSALNYYLIYNYYILTLEKV